MSETFVSLLGNKIGTLRLPLVDEGEIKPCFGHKASPGTGMISAGTFHSGISPDNSSDHPMTKAGL
jgi:hypothetical protein